jgi:DNA polymerase I-like protein with 3'-5' exonuclease and polymerase domains
MNILAVDLETTRIGPDSVIPNPICAATFDGHIETVRKDDSFDFLHEPVDKIIFHNAKFDLSVIYAQADALLRKRIIYLIENDMISDTLIREKLYKLSTKGELIKYRYSLAALTERYLGRVREDKELALGFEELANVPLEEWPEDMLHYVLTDVKDTRSIWLYQEELRTESGPGSMNTEQLQIAADLALQFITARGIRVDQAKLHKLRGELGVKTSALEEDLVELGLGEVNKKGVFKRNMKVFREYISSLGSAAITEKGAVSIGEATLKELEQTEEIRLWREYSKIQKLVTTYLPKMESESGVVHPSYDILKETGRTSSRASKLYPSTNIQNQPRFPGIRELFIPREGKVFVSIDYSNLELCSAAQVFYEEFGESLLRDAINEGDEPADLHTRLGKILAKLDEHKQDDKYYRTLAKPINLGYPGGIGAAKISEIATNQYDVELSVEKAKELRKVFFKEYPEIQRYLHQYSYGQRKSNGKFYYETNGRFRNNCTYTAFCNGKAMQSLAADGAKLAIWECFKEDMPMVAFIHDEIIFEFDKGDEESILKAMDIMLDSMKQVIPDVRLTVEAQVMDKWTKEGSFLGEYRRWK